MPKFTKHIIGELEHKLSIAQDEMFLAKENNDPVNFLDWKETAKALKKAMHGERLTDREKTLVYEELYNLADIADSNYHFAKKEEDEKARKYWRHFITSVPILITEAWTLC